MDVTHIDSPEIKNGIITLVFTGAAGHPLGIDISASAAVRLASVLLFRLSQLPSGTDPGPGLQVVSVPATLDLLVGIPDIKDVVARIGPLAIDLGPLESIRNFLTQESSLLHAAPTGKQ